jgi:CSLREA domain-containing protein
MLMVLGIVTLPAIPAQGVTTFTVTSTADAPDSDPTDGLCSARGVGCTLRAAIQQANTTTARDRIAFRIPGSLPRTIRPAGGLPVVLHPIILDGYTQPGSRENTLTNGTNAIIAIQLDGSLSPEANGLVLRTDHSVVRGLAVNNWVGTGPSMPVTAGIGIWIDGGSNNRLEGNFIGTDVTAQISLGNTLGVAISGYAGFVANANVIGGSAASRRNVITGNAEGVQVFGGGASSNEIQGNLIGTDATGVVGLGNFVGVAVIGAPMNHIGGTTAGARNIVSANRFAGIEVFESPITDLATGNRIEGNFIGTDTLGTGALANGTFVPERSAPGGGVDVQNADGTVIGGAADGAGNVISGNANDGVHVATALRTTVAGNLIGTDLTGTQPLGNGEDGLSLEGANQVVGAPGAGNVISANAGRGMVIVGGTDVIQGNLIGTDVSGLVPLGNGGDGIEYTGSDTSIGGNSSGAGNVIAASAESGLHLVDAARVTVEGNRIGVDGIGSAALGNVGQGVWLERSTDIVVGGPVSGARNVISANGAYGILIDYTSTGSSVLGNRIGTDATGTAALPNGADGIFSIADRTTIGGPGGAGNVISGNHLFGVTINAVDSLLQGNFIGTDASGFLAIGNLQGGIRLIGNDNLVGGTTLSLRNIISGNSHDGIQLIGDDNRIQGNLIGIGIEGDPLGNKGNGISIAGMRTSVGGSATNAGNVVAFNSLVGVLIASGIGNHLESNSIYENGLLGIDLEGDDVTENDPEDVDAGANLLQNFPSLTEVSVSPVLGITKIQGSLDSTPDTYFRLEFFSNEACDPSNHGEGRVVLGTMVVATDGFGQTDFNASYPVVIQDGAEVTATATDLEAFNNTSEFSACRTAVAA